MSLSLMLAISALACLGRFLVPGHSLSWPGTYEAAVHIWCGALIVLAVKDRPRRLWYICVLTGISLFELAKFLARR
jgi:hypothetical protein